jgi:hypothetical protein
MWSTAFKAERLQQEEAQMSRTVADTLVGALEQIGLHSRYGPPDRSTALKRPLSRGFSSRSDAATDNPEDGGKSPAGGEVLDRSLGLWKSCD